MKVIVKNESKVLAFILTKDNKQIPVKAGDSIILDDKEIKAVPSVLKVTKYFEKNIANDKNPFVKKDSSTKKDVETTKEDKKTTKQSTKQSTKKSTKRTSTKKEKVEETPKKD